MNKKITLEEIRKALEEIKTEMAGAGKTKKEEMQLEQASIHLRNLEALLVTDADKQLIISLKNETVALHTLTLAMTRKTKRLGGVTEMLRKIVKTTGQIVDILELVK